MSEKSFFRVLLVASIFFPFLSLIAGESFIEGLPISLQDYLAVEANREIPFSELIFSLVIAFAILVLLVTSMIGLWKFKRWGRTLYAVLVIITIPAVFLIGPVVQNTWEAMFDEIGIILEGILLAMMFTGNISQRFQPTAVD